MRTTPLEHVRLPIGHIQPLKSESQLYRSSNFWSMKLQEKNGPFQISSNLVQLIWSIVELCNNKSYSIMCLSWSYYDHIFYIVMLFNWIYSPQIVKLDLFVCGGGLLKLKSSAPIPKSFLIRCHHDASLPILALQPGRCTSCTRWSGPNDSISYHPRRKWCSDLPNCVLCV